MCNWYSEWKKPFAWYLLMTLRYKEREYPKLPTQRACGEWDALWLIEHYNKSLIELLWDRISAQTAQCKLIKTNLEDNLEASGASLSFSDLIKSDNVFAIILISFQSFSDIIQVFSVWNGKFYLICVSNKLISLWIPFVNLWDFQDT